jgi:hypothetical protein
MENFSTTAIASAIDFDGIHSTAALLIDLPVMIASICC